MSFVQDSTPNTGQELTIERTFEVPPATLFDMWAEPRHLREWSCPRGFTITDASGDRAHRGGAFQVVMEGPDGAAHVLQGTYLDVEPGQRISFTHQWKEGDQLSPETVVTARFDQAEDGGTRLVLHQGFFANAAIRDGHEGGWSESLEKLDEYLLKERPGLHAR